MSVTDLLTRAEALCKKYEKYDLDKKQDATVYKNDRFMMLYTTLQADLEAAMQKANDASIEKNRAVVATLNAEVRRAKAALKEQIPKLTKYAGKKVKGATKEDLALRPDLVLGLVAKIEDIPDGVVAPRKPVKGKKGKGAAETIKIDAMSPEQVMSGSQNQSSEESSSFAQEADRRKAKQDESLEVISEGLTTLGNMAQDINEEMDKQTTLVDEIDSKVDKAATEMKSTNVRLKETLVRLRSSRNIMVDIVCLIVIMSIAAALYKFVNLPPTFKHFSMNLIFRL
ncbi:syntaxin of plants SYP7 [Marchantia polymorpha subsp. ruderalis]|uniref:t-SNARE coiled-coil homology domain-containing protein n=2 Tax=Marchantia polymorpha TaxID=3197 RepID=A0AAF6AR53_MARPO|nr:hypothetical protein MARPO_0001s0062 [Marchantia polymorpha]BAS01264.1 syntaxin of plant 7B.1 [Marchantia polymorpha]BBM98923.1 hypothetical protein Mp_1g17220 [Marchantia polymorpha subsp. ruderalis]|eukprot:PTQ49998.1 hypothetical protein MARPO_0001s0062 [Marchantia polymorpha]